MKTKKMEAKDAPSTDDVMAGISNVSGIIECVLAELEYADIPAVGALYAALNTLQDLQSKHMGG